MKTINTVESTKKYNLCVSCEICRAVCPSAAISMTYEGGQFLPVIDTRKCNHCGRCIAVCPGIDIDPMKLRYTESPSTNLSGEVRASYTVYSNDSNMRMNSASGGVITSLLIRLLENNDIDAAFVVPFRKFEGTPVMMTLTKNPSDIYSAAKSKYLPVSAYSCIEAIRKNNKLRYAIVATPCVTLGIKKYLNEQNISGNNLIFLGLFCDKIFNFNILRYFKDMYGRENESIEEFCFKTKENSGWPGNTKISFSSRRSIVIHRKIRQQLKPYFQLSRCLFCYDKFNFLSDIVFGDCRVPGKSDIKGKSNVLIRTKRGETIFNKYSRVFSIENEDIETIKKSQYLAERSICIKYAKYIINKYALYNEKSLKLEKGMCKIKKIITGLQTKISFGKNYRPNTIKMILFYGLVKAKLLRLLNMFLSGILLTSAILKDILAVRRKKRPYSGRNIVIIGGGLSNKGAQAMTFTVVSQLKNRHPDKNIYLFSNTDFKRSEEEKKKYNFSILPWGLREILATLTCYQLHFGRDNKKIIHARYVREIIKQSVCFIDISGYALSSQFDFLASIIYILNIMVANKFSIPYYILPQSIGPFDYSILQKLILFPLFKIYLPYPKKIFAREHEGYRLARWFTKKNVALSNDIVMQNNEYDIGSIYNNSVKIKDIKIRPNSIAIIPNSKVIKRDMNKVAYKFYAEAIERLTSSGIYIYIISHCEQDINICNRLLQGIDYSQNVILIKDDLNCIELERLIKQFDFIIASRYHSIVHAYKNCVPVLAIGWATKYHELLKNLNQLQYYIDIRESLDTNKMNNALNALLNSYSHEKSVLNKIKSLNIHNIFDKLVI